MAGKILEEDIHKILAKYTKSSSAKLINYKFSPLSSEVEGFMGDYNILEVEFDTSEGSKHEKFFVKGIPTHTEFQTRIATERNVYGKEVFFFDKLMKEYDGLGLDVSFAPRCYYCKDDQMLIMENLVSKGFELSKKNTCYDLEQCLTGVKALALYHGSSILYEEKMSSKLGKQFRLDIEYPKMFEENYYCLDLESEIEYEIFEKTIDSIKFIVDSLKKEKNYKSEFIESLVAKTHFNCFREKTNYRKATGHGDLWFNNIFFKYVDSKAVQCKIIDFQILRYMYPTYDVILFIHLNTNKNFRLKHRHFLLDYYYEQMRVYFADHGYDIYKIYPVKEFEETLKLVEFCALFNVISMGTLIFMSAETLKELYAIMDDNTFNTHEEMFRKQFLIPSEYQTKLSEAIDDLYEIFLTTQS